MLEIDSLIYNKFLKLEDLTLPTAEVYLIIKTSKQGGDSMSLQKTLDEVMPSYVILYAADISTVRQLEVIRNLT